MNFKFFSYFFLFIVLTNLFSADFTVSTTADSGPGSLRTAIESGNTHTDTTNTISIDAGIGTITLLSPLPLINPASDKTVTIQGPSATSPTTIDGNNAHRGFFARQGTITLKNMTVQNTKAQGGKGGDAGSEGSKGGGGAGLGGGLFVHQDAMVTLSNVSFSDCAAEGGSAGNTISVLGPGCGGGGGLHGNGGHSGNGGAGGGGGGFYGNGGNAGILSSSTRQGHVGGGGGGGFGSEGGDGGMSGGGGGGGSLAPGTDAGAATAGNGGNNGGGAGGKSLSTTTTYNNGAPGIGGGNASVIDMTLGQGWSGGDGAADQGLSGGGGGGGAGYHPGFGGLGGFVSSSGFGAASGGAGCGEQGNQNGRNGEFGAGGSGASNGNDIDNKDPGFFPAGGNGDFGGGGAGGASMSDTHHAKGGGGGNGGLGGGGGGAGVKYGAKGTATSGSSLFGGGDGGEPLGNDSPGGGGGGAGLGGAVFVMSGGSLIVQDGGAYTGSSSKGGDPTDFGTSTVSGSQGQALGKDLFLMSGTNVTFNIPDKTTLKLTNPIESDRGAGGGSGGMLIKDGTGRLDFSELDNNSYTGNTTLKLGPLQISKDEQLGDPSSQIVFDPHASSMKDLARLSIVDTFTSNRQIEVKSEAMIEIADNKTLTLTGKIFPSPTMLRFFILGTDDSGMITGGTLVLTNIDNDLNIAALGNGGTLSVAKDKTFGQSLILLNGQLLATDTFTSAIPISLVDKIGHIKVADTKTLSLTGEITGAGTLKAKGPGALFLGNAGNSYSGGTVLSDGVTLSIEDEVLGSVAGALTFDDGILHATDTFISSRNIIADTNKIAHIKVADTKTLSLTGEITGAGTLMATGPGTLSLGNTGNNYSGGTVLSEGVSLAISKDGVLGDIVGVLTFDDGVLHATGSFISPRNIIADTNKIAHIKVADTKMLGLTGEIMGEGALMVEGPGTLSLGNTGSSYSGGTTLFGGGVLSVFLDEPLGAATGTLTFDDGTLHATDTFTSSRNVTSNTNAHFRIANGKELTLTGTITGPGMLTKDDLGTLVLIGSNNYTGGTTVSAGVLQGTTNSLQGAITNNASVVFDQTTNGTYAGVISGTGTLTQQNTGKVILSGANTYTGTTEIRQGTLEVNGSITSPVTVFPSGTLQGTGTVGTTQNNGIVSPGSSIGTLTVTGDYTHDPSAFLHIEIDDAPLASDLLLITGTANLDGSVRVIPCPGLYEAGMVFAFLQAHTVNGTFNQLLETPPLDFALRYLTNTVQLIILTDQVIFPVSVDRLSGNTKNIANYLSSYSTPLSPAFVSIFRTLLNMSPSEFPQALLRLGPQQFGGLSLSNLQTHVRMSRSMNRTKDVFDQSYFSECHPRWNQPFVWLTPMGHYYKQNKMQGQTSFTDKTYGVTAGYGITFFDHLLVSGGIGYSHSDIDWEDNQGDATIHSVFLSPSVGYIGQYGYVGLVVTGSRSFYDVNRNVRFSTFKDSAHNDHKSYNLLTGLELGTYIKLPESFQKNLYFSPVAGLDYVNIFERGYQESGAGPINLSVQNKHTAFLHPKILLKLLKESQRSSLCVLPSLYIGYSSNVPLTNGTYTSRFYKQQTCQKRFNVRSYDKTTHQMLLGAELKMLQKTNFESTIKYEAGLGSRYTIQEVNLNLSWSW